MISLEPYDLNGLKLKNKIVLPPMCMFTAGDDGEVTDFHKTHYQSRAIGGVGLIILEATAVSPNGRITSEDLGLWKNKHTPGLRQIVRNTKKYGAKIGIQLAHAGRKCLANDVTVVGPSPIAYDENSIIPTKLSKEEIDKIVFDFQKAADRADEAGFDLLEIHAAHGYLIHQFLSPLSNQRTDAYGGSLENRTRLLKEIIGAVKKVWPNDKPVIIRVSADDYTDGGIDINEMIKIVNNVKPFIDMVHVSSGGLVPAEIELYEGYQVKYAERIKKACDIPTISVGLINDIELIEEILEEDKSDLVALGRKLLREPNFVINTIYENKLDYDFPREYERAYRY